MEKVSSVEITITESKGNLDLTRDNYDIGKAASTFQNAENLLYKTFKQQSGTGEIDKSDIKFMELIDYEPKYDEEYMKSLRKRLKNPGFQSWTRMNG